MLQVSAKKLQKVLDDSRKIPTFASSNQNSSHMEKKITIYIVQLRFANGCTETKFSTRDRQYAAGFCKRGNETYVKLGSPNRYFFEEMEFSYA